VTRLVNCDINEVDHIQRISSNIDIIDDQVELSTRRDMTSNGELLQDGILPGVEKTLTSFRGARWLYSELMAYCSNIKVDTIVKCLEKYNQSVVYIDADTIVRKNLSPLDTIINNHDICMVIDEPYTSQHTGSKRLEEQKCLYQGGLMCVNNTSNALKFMKEFLYRISCEMKDWDADEGIFYEIIENNIVDIKIGSLPRTFKDEDIFREDSYMWSGSGNSKYCNQRYVDEFQSY